MFLKLLRCPPDFILVQNSAGSLAGTGWKHWRGHVPAGTIAIWRVRMK